MDPLYLYLSGLIVGGIAVGASLFGGDGDGVSDGLQALAFLRLRLFFFFAFFFGLAGMLGSLLMGPGAALFTALGSGVVCCLVGRLDAEPAERIKRRQFAGRATT